MSISYTTRNLYPAELKLLKSLKSRQEKEGRNKIKFYHFIIAGLLGTACTYLASLWEENFWGFFFGTVAVLSFGFIIFIPYEIYKLKNKNKAFLKELNARINNGLVKTCTITASRIAVAKEYEDEGDLFFVEYETHKVLHIWDYDHSFQKRFPCLQFEIYEDSFYKLSGRQINPLSERIHPLSINSKAKWNYMTEIGAPEHLETINTNLDQIIDEYNGYNK